MLLLALTLFVLGWSLGFSFSILFLALAGATFAVLLVFPGRHVVRVISRDRSAAQVSSEKTDRQPALTRDGVAGRAEILDSSDPVERPPAPFKKRLAQFLHCDENTLNQVRRDERSKMKFWSAVAFGPRRGGKPRWFIRAILERIRQLVHG